MSTQKTIYAMQPAIDCIAASDASRAAVEMATKLGVRVNVAVLDRAGLLVAFLRMPGSALHSHDIAIDKAYTAVSFGLPTSMWNNELKNHSEGVQKGLILRPRFTIFGGGLPILANGELIGGIGVSGATESEDAQCAQAGLVAIDLGNN